MAAAGSPSPAAAVVSLAPCFSVYCRIALLPLLFPAWSSCSSLCLILCGFWGKSESFKVLFFYCSCRLKIDLVEDVYKVAIFWFCC
ncbi:unnamed protein product [Linum trigynum]|uniref:Secreted protein n=1 Tax=Linum trigynum TaxID=586398 RepID=A0AAV2DF88_9ROSI